MNERIKKLRKALDLTQQAFADRLGIRQNTIAKYETNRGNPTTSVISLICREFNVNETWLRTGEGEMFVKHSGNEVLGAQIRAFLQGGTDSFRERLVSLLIGLPPEYWEVLERYALELVNGTDSPDPEPGAVSPAAPIVPPGYSSREELEAEARAEAERYYEQVLSEKKQALQASSAKESDAG